jgi:hypothetical protein
MTYVNSPFRLLFLSLLSAALVSLSACKPRIDAPPVPAGEEADGPGIPLTRSTPVTFGATGCPTVVVGPKVWDVKKLETLGQLQGADQQPGLRALSADGRWFAAAARSANQTDTAVGVWSTRTGKKVLTVPGKKDVYVDLLAFSGGKNLLLGGRHGNTIDVWDVEKAERVRTVAVPGKNGVQVSKLAFSPDAARFACIDHDKLIVRDTATGKQAISLAAPGGAHPTDAIFVYAWTEALAFSPDGKELAAFTVHPQPRLLCWNARGKLVLDEPVPTPLVVSHRTSLHWLPDRSGWLVNGYLFDRASRRVLLSIRVPFASDVLPHVLDRKHVAAAFGKNGSRLRTVELPWARMKASLEQMKRKAPAFLTPSEPISLEVNATGARGDINATRKLLTEAITKRLARDGIRVAKGRPTVLRLHLAERAGDTLPIHERQTPFDWRGRDTGRKATEAKGAATLELVARGEDAPLWRGHLAAASSRSFSEPITNAVVRRSMLESLSRQLNGLDMPYFIPRSQDDVALPAVIE